MPATSTLQERRHARICYLLLLDGIEQAFSDDPILVSGTFTGSLGHTVLPYLDTSDTTVQEALDLRSGKLDDTPATFTLRDLDRSGVLPSLFRAFDDTEEPLEQSVYPGDDLSSRTELHDMHIGTECIGSSGERHRFPCVSDLDFGMMHVGLDQDLPNLRAAPVSERPIVWAGRRAALYRCYVDVDGTRRPFSEATRIWWGTMLDQGRVDGRAWRIECEGQRSWLRKDLGALTQREPARAFGLVELSDVAGQDETRIGVNMRRLGTWDAALNEAYGRRDFTAAISGITVADIIADIAAELQTAAGTAGADGTFSASDNRYIIMDGLGRLTLHVDDAVSAKAIVSLTLHRTVWEALGYLPEVQRQEDGALFVPFEAYDSHDVEGLPNAGAVHGAAPGPGYITARLTTEDPADPLNGTNSGYPRTYEPRYPGGTTALLAGLNNGRGQVVDLGDGLGSTVIYASGQLSHPVASDPDDPASPYSIPEVGECSRQGLWLFFGKRRHGDREFDEYQVARASWRAGAIFQRGQVLGSRIVIIEWLDPRMFGFDRPKLTTDWVARANADDKYMIQAVPILALDYRRVDHERAHVVIERLLRSTGTSEGWDSYDLDPGASLDPGDNNSAGTPPRDAEVPDLGLAVPDSMVQSILQFGLEGDGLPAELGDVKVAFSPGESSEDLLEGIMRPFGWAWSLRDGRYGIFSPYRVPEPTEIDLVLDGSTKLGSSGDDREGSISQDVRAFAPIDRFSLQYGWAPHVNKHRDTFEVDSKDVGRRYRSGGMDEQHASKGMTRINGWPTKARELGEWWAQRHFFIREWPYLGRRQPRIGEFVRISDPRGVNPAGSYGLDGMIGLITRVSTTLRPGDDEPFVVVDVLVYANTGRTQRLHGVVARVVGIDTDNDRLYVADNFLAFSHPDGWPGDASFFVTPTFPGIEVPAGDADVEIYQWNGNAWRPPITGLSVTGTGTDVNGTYVQMSGTISPFFYKMDTVLVYAPRGVQAAQWVLDHYGVTCDKAGEFGGSPGFKWED